MALVIGNSDYALVSSLANPANDAALMAETLREVGFDVIEAKNADQRTMKRAISNFGRRLEAAGKDGVGLFYYAGHAVEARGVNYLIPLDAPIERTGDLDIEAVSAQWVLTQMEIAGNGLNVVILDSCRNNPFKGAFRAATRGLARMKAPSGSYIAYAAAPGELASDGDGSNSPYTTALAAAIVEPGLKLEDAFKRVRALVHGQSGGKQTPWEEGSVIGDFYFVPPGSTVTVTPPGAPPPQPPPPAPPAFDARALELAFWNSIEKSADPADFEDYLARYPDGAFSGLAKRRLTALTTERKPAEDQVAALPPAQLPPAQLAPAQSSRSGDSLDERQEISAYLDESKGSMFKKLSNFFEEKSFYPGTWGLSRIYGYKIIDVQQDRVVLAITFEVGTTGQTFGSGGDSDTWKFQLRWAGGQLEFIDRIK